MRSPSRAATAAKLATAALTLAALLTPWTAGLAPDLPLPSLRGARFPFLGAALALALAARLALWLAYRPARPTAAERAALPTLTVVIPAYNEGPGVRRTIDSVLASAYPPERLRVIAVNDGSKDDTGRHLDDAARAHPDRVTALHLPRNAGKRHALYAGFSRATSELVATVDSDSTVPPESLAHLVTPLARDPKVGGVAGRVLVANRNENLLTRLLGVRYILGFDFIRGYQSVLRTVWCCPGALQAYRLALIAPHLEAWRDQRFLGAACTNGDDHALTNLVLSLDHDTVYQQSAEVHTLVPARYVKLSKMYLRWGRSATREGLRALAFTSRRLRRLGPWRGPLMAADGLLRMLVILTKLLGLPLALYALFTDPLWLVHGALAATAGAALYALVFLRSERSTESLFAITYTWFALLALFWIQPLATLTVRKNGWMTRG